MGDSYSAGPGAGSPFPSDEGSCYRTWGSYGAQLFLDFPETQGTFDFTACSGHTTQDFLDQQIFKLFNMPSPELVILTIGGNDALFGDIVKSCVLGFQLLTGKSCDQAIAAGKNVIGSATFQNQLFKVWNGIFDKLEITGNNCKYNAMISSRAVSDVRSPGVPRSLSYSFQPSKFTLVVYSNGINRHVGRPLV
jgi:lysophospholipase L1-like esterase